MEISTDVVDLVHRALHETVHGIAVTDEQVQAQMDLQEEALAAIESVTNQQLERPGLPGVVPSS